MFHRQIGVMTGNPVVIAICDQLAEIMDQPLWRRLRDDSLSDASRMRIHIAEHRMIYEAVIEGDAEAAELYSRQHIRRVRRYMTGAAMRASRYFSAVDSHTEGMPTRVITGGLGVVPGATMQERRLYFERNLDDLRLLLMREPRGHSAMSGAFLQPPTRPDADWGVLFVEVSGLLPMCGHGTIGVATVLVECGMVTVTEPETIIRLDTPAGLVEATVSVRDGRAERVSLRNVPAFVVGLDAEVEVAGFGTVRYDMAFGGNFYALVAADSVGLDPVPASGQRLIDAGLAIAGEINRSARPVHPLDPAIGGCKHVVFHAAATTERMPATPPRSIRAGSTVLPAAPGPRRGWRRSTRAASWRSARSSSMSR